MMDVASVLQAKLQYLKVHQNNEPKINRCDSPIIVFMNTKLNLELNLAN